VANPSLAKKKTGTTVANKKPTVANFFATDEPKNEIFLPQM